LKSRILRTFANLALLLACTETMAAPIEPTTTAFRDAPCARAEADLFVDGFDGSPCAHAQP
jgi:hypothetical protein